LSWQPVTVTRGSVDGYKVRAVSFLLPFFSLYLEWDKNGKIPLERDLVNSRSNYCEQILRGCYSNFLTLSLPECLIEFCRVTLTFESVDEILWCDRSNESSLPVLSHDTIYFSKFYRMKFGHLVEICLWPRLAVKGLICLAYTCSEVGLDEVSCSCSLGKQPTFLETPPVVSPQNDV